MIYWLMDKNLENQLKNDIGNSPGVYILFSKIDNTVKTVPRALGVDEEGQLYIGRGVNLRKRISELKSRIFLFRRKHSGGSRYNSNQALKTAFPKESLHIRIGMFDDPEEAERKLLFDYIKRFGELPPLNRQRGKNII